MAKVTPTTKSCSEICFMLTGSGGSCYGKYVQTTFDPTSTHALYGVHREEMEQYKEKIKSIGGKYIRVVKGRDKTSPYVVICFALEITPQEALEEKMKKDAEEKRKIAYESKLAEINYSILLQNAGATSERGKQNFARYLLNPEILDPMVPFESYVWIDQPSDKDEKRIYDIVNKANQGYPGCVGMVTTQMYKMKELACQMNNAITDENKRMRRRAAALKYGLKFLADCFMKKTA